MESSMSVSHQDLPRVFQVPNVVLPPELQSMGRPATPSAPGCSGIRRGDRAHSSLRIPKPSPSKKRLCRHHSDSETAREDRPKRRTTRPRSRRVVRSVSAIETDKAHYRPRVRRSISERSTLIMAGKHLVPPRARPLSKSEGGSRGSSTRTLSSNVSLSEIVAVELGLKDIPGLTPKEARRRRVVCTVMVVFATILVLSVVLVALTLFLSPAVDEVLRKGNEEIYRSMSAGASTSSPTTDGAVVANHTAPSNGTPG